MARTSRTVLDFFSPLFFPLMSLILSIVLCFYVHHQKISSFICFLFFWLLVTAIIYTKNSRFIPITLACLILACIGWVRTTAIFERSLSFPFDKPCTALQCTVISTSIAPKSRMRHCLSLSLISINQQPMPSSYIIQLYTPRPLPVEIGDIIEINTLTFKKTMSLDFTTYLLKEGITATVFAEHVDYTCIARPPSLLARWIFNERNHLLQVFKDSLSKPAFALFSSLFLGERTTSANDLIVVQKHFKQWGILHYLARSGLHLVIVISIYEFLCRLLPISFVYKHLLLLVLNIIYFLLSWPSVSFIRALLIFVWYKLFSLMYIPTHFLHILYLTCIIILLYNPLQLFFLDFQLSFGFTFALGWLNQYKVDQKI